MNIPHRISIPEWQEIMHVPEISESWGLSDETPEQFAGMAYGAHFDFVSGGPGYAGDLYVIHGDAIGEPVTLIRRDGKLAVV
jgi:hypothetical protein